MSRRSISKDYLAAATALNIEPTELTKTALGNCNATQRDLIKEYNLLDELFTQTDPAHKERILKQLLSRKKKLLPIYLDNLQSDLQKWEDKIPKPDIGIRSGEGGQQAIILNKVAQTKTVIKAITQLLHPTPSSPQSNSTLPPKREPELKETKARPYVQAALTLDFFKFTMITKSRLDRKLLQAKRKAAKDAKDESAQITKAYNTLNNLFTSDTLRVTILTDLFCLEARPVEDYTQDLIEHYRNLYIDKCNHKAKLIQLNKSDDYSSEENCQKRSSLLINITNTEKVIDAIKTLAPKVSWAKEHIRIQMAITTKANAKAKTLTQPSRPSDTSLTPTELPKGQRDSTSPKKRRTHTINRAAGKENNPKPIPKAPKAIKRRTPDQPKKSHHRKKSGGLGLSCSITKPQKMTDSDYQIATSYFFVLHNQLWDEESTCGCCCFFTRLFMRSYWKGWFYDNSKADTPQELIAKILSKAQHRSGWFFGYGGKTSRTRSVLRNLNLNEAQIDTLTTQTLAETLKGEYDKNNSTRITCLER